MVGVRELSPELLAVAMRDLHEVPERREQDLAHIKEWLAKQPHLNANTDDQFLIAFLRGCKFSLERTKEKLDSYYTMRTALPEFFTRRDPMLPELQEMLKLGNAIPLPGVDEKGRRVMMMRMETYDPSKMTIENMFKLNMMMMDIMLIEDDVAMVNGSVNVMDMKGTTMAHTIQMQPSIIKKTMTCFQEGYPVRPKGMNYINMSPIIEAPMNLFKTFMKEKLRKRIFIHSNGMESLYKNIPKKILPKEYGGDAGPIDELAAAWKKKIESYRDYLLADEIHKSDEKKRPGKPKTHEDLFGLEGSFRQLNVD